MWWGPAAGNMLYLRSRVINLCRWRFIDSEFELLVCRNFQIAEVGLALVSLYVAIVADIDIGYVIQYVKY